MRTMIRMVFLSTLMLSGYPWPVRAQSFQDELQVIRSVWHKEKKEIVREYMQLNTEDESKFWPVYDAYTAERIQLANARIAILVDFTDHYSNLTDAKAEELTNRIFDNEIHIVKLQKKYYSKFKKALTAYKASQFMQLENYLQTMIRSEIQDDIPFIGDLEKSKGS